MGEGAERGAAGAGTGQRSTRAHCGPGLSDTTPCRVTEATTASAAKAQKTTAGAAKEEAKAQTETTSSAKTSTMTAAVENPQETSPMAIASVSTPQMSSACVEIVEANPCAMTGGDEKPQVSSGTLFGITKRRITTSASSNTFIFQMVLLVLLHHAMIAPVSRLLLVAACSTMTYEIHSRTPVLCND
jgi:hypothetical protein